MQVHPSRYSSSSEAFCTKKLELDCSLRSWLRCPPAVYTEVSSFSSFTFSQEKKKFSSFMKFSLELTFANAFYHCNYFLPNEKTNNLSMYIFFTFWEPLDLYTFLIQVLKGALLVFVHHGLGLSFLIINITNTTRNQTNKKQKTELYKSYFHQVHSCVVETSKIKKGNKKKNLEPPEFT